MTRWEYKTYPVVLSGEPLERDLNDLGADGWQLLACDGVRYVFGRVKEA